MDSNLDFLVLNTVLLFIIQSFPYYFHNFAITLSHLGSSLLIRFLYIDSICLNNLFEKETMYNSLNINKRIH